MESAQDKYAMCYSAQIRTSYKRYVREWGADISIKQFVRLYWLRSQGAKIKIPKAMDAAFSEPETDDERQIKEMIDAYDKEQASKIEQELFKQRKRLADAERTLQTKMTKAAAESKRISTDKVELCLGKLADLRRTELNDEDHRIFPGHLRIAEDARPVGEAEVGGDDQAGVLVELANEMEQQRAAGLAEGQIPEFIKDDEIGGDEAGRELSLLAGELLQLKRVDQLDGREEAHAAMQMFDRMHAERGGEVRLAGAWAADEHDVLGLAHEVAAVQLSRTLRFAHSRARSNFHTGFSYRTEPVNLSSLDPAARSGRCSKGRKLPVA